ncbi:MAG: AAA family ATPase [Bacteroidales bacterium]|nr:AAA family ATPase [Candidatus Latescibacterota bacterium]
MPDPAAQTTELADVMANCLSLDNPRSLFLFAGAGSGKTRAVVEAMKKFREKHGQSFRLSGRNVGVITYTNAACDEIKHRTYYDPIFSISTIHSFAWELIRSYHDDIREWLDHNLTTQISDLEEKQRKGRAGKASADRVVQIEKKKARLARLDTIKYFAYNPNGDNIGKNSLNHTEVICISTAFLADKLLMQRILIRKYPILLVDEVQDTQKDLIDAFLAVQQEHSKEFCLALFGDEMQRIYSDGKTGIAKAIPDDWAKPAITINHRCPKRIVRLINTIRAEADGQAQEPREDASEGFVRLFLVQDGDETNKTAVESEIARRMAEVTSDNQWFGENREVKTLTLEHHMAARRGGFSDFFEPLYQVAKFKTGLLDGTLSGIPFFAQKVLPLVTALQSADRFAVARIVKKSPLVSADTLKLSKSPMDEIHKADDTVRSLFTLWDDDNDPSLIAVLKAIAAIGLLAIPDVFAPVISRPDSAEDESDADDPAESAHDPSIDAWDKALTAPFSQLKSYVQYISDESPFGTHQGIKGLEYPRVMVILDDNEARGFMFSYDKLFGAKEPTSTDQRNLADGKETAVDRTRRLFYVTCSRTKNSLAIVAYTVEKEKVTTHLKNAGWFEDDEIIDI